MILAGDNLYSSEYKPFTAMGSERPLINSGSRCRTIQVKGFGVRSTALHRFLEALCIPGKENPCLLTVHLFISVSGNVQMTLENGCFCCAHTYNVAFTAVNAFLTHLSIKIFLLM